jgi:predicted GNAT family N-acyltransferase
MSQPERVEPVVYRVAGLDEILDLREALIIRGTQRPREYPGDRLQSTLHFGAFAGQTNVCCASFFLNEWFGEPAYQLRGMATDHAFQRRNMGANLLASAESWIRKRTKVRQLWCSARIPAVGFYHAQGWSTVSEPYDVPNIGPHSKMCKRLL